MRKLTHKESIAVAVSLAVIGFLLFGAQFWSLFNGGSAAGLSAANSSSVLGDIPSSGVKVKDVIVGTGRAAKAGDTITVNYVGMLVDGKVFDSSIDRGQPYTFILGTGQVIKGWDEGIKGMKVGGKRTLIIAPDYAYGNQHVGPIPANSPLVFDVELLDIAK